MGPLIAVFLALTSASSAAPLQAVPWSWEDASGWTPAERARVADAAGTLPDELVSPLGRLRVHLEPTPPLPDDLTTPHRLVELKGRRLFVRVRGLDDAIDAWSERHPDQAAPALADSLLRRQLAHALAHGHSRMHRLAGRSSWRSLSGWGDLLPRRHPAETAPLAYATPHGQHSAIEDLATTVERFVVADRLPGDLARPPACRMPAKWRFVARALHTTPRETACIGLREVGLAPEQVQSIEIAYFVASTGHPASIGGHTGIVVTRVPDASGLVERESFNMAAATGSETGIGYAWKGLTGGWRSRVLRQPYRQVALHYGLGEDRDTLRYRLRVEGDAKRRVLERLTELEQAWDRPYTFVHRNCSELPRALAEAALGRKLRLPPEYGPDALLAALAREGLIDGASPPTLAEHGRSPVASAARALRRREEQVLLRAHPQQAAPLRRAFRRARSHRPHRRAEAYRSLQTLLATPSPAAAVALERYLALSDRVERRSGVGNTEVMDSIRASKHANRAYARRQDLSEVLQVRTNDSLRAALERPAPDGSDHTPLRTLTVGGTMRNQGDGFQPWLSVKTQLYDSRLGRARRFALASGMELLLLASELRFGVGAQRGYQVRGTLFRLSKIHGARIGLNPGRQLRLVELEVTRRPSSTAWDARWLELGPRLELLQSADHRHHLVVGAGVAARSLLQPWALHRSEHAAGLGLPLRLDARIGSARHALSGLDLQVTFEPVLATGGPWYEITASSQLQAHLGAVLGVDTALQASTHWRRRDTRRTTSSTAEIGVAVVFEPY